MSYPPAQQSKEFLDDSGNPVILDDSGNIVSAQSTEALDDSGNVIDKAVSFGKGALRGTRDLALGFGKMLTTPPVNQAMDIAMNLPAEVATEGLGSGLASAAESITGLPLRAAKSFYDEPSFEKAGELLPVSLLTALGVRSATKGMKSGKSKVIEPTEILPPEKPRIAGLLESEPYIAGVDGRVQKRSLINPQEEARLAGYDIDANSNPVGKPGQNTGTTIDLGELREIERQKNLRYTDFELQGGKALELQLEKSLDPPAVVDDTRLGFEALTPRSGDLQYPNNVVPQAVLPRTSQSQIQALTPERFAEPIQESQPFKFANEVVPKPIPEKAGRNLMGGTAAITPDEVLLPSAIKSTRRQVKENTGLDAPVAGATKLPPTTPPEVKTAVKDGVTKFVQESKSPSILFKSVYTQLGELGASGKELVQRFQRAAQHRSEYDAVWTEPLFRIGGKLNKSEFANFGQYVEGTLPIPNERVQLAVSEWNKAQNQMGDMAVSKKLHLKRGDEVIPFEKIENNYWPHIPTENLTKATIVERLMKGGMTRHEAVVVAKRWENTGEIFLRGQHSRLKDSFQYRQDFDVAIHHGRSMSKRIANHENLGPKDIAGKGDEGIANLIEDSDDPNLAYKLAKRLAGREELPNEKLINGLNQARKWMSLTSLPNFTIPNVILGQATNAHMALLSRHPISAAIEVSKLIKSSYRDQVRASGAFNSFNRTMLEELSGVDPFQIGAGEKINRSIAGAIGKSTVREAFIDYKAGTNTQSAKYYLETLLSRNPDTIQAITPELEKFAAGRMAEITQGLNNPGNLPYGWSNPINSYGSVAQQLFLIFKKVGFQTTKTIKDSVKANPVLGTASWLAISQVAGEMVGDVKSAITGRERPDDITRIADNWGNAFMLGLPWELATSAQYGPSALIASAAGPAFGKASELAYSSYNTGKNLIEGNDDPFKPIRRFGLKNLPIPGRERIKTAVEED